MSSRVSSSSTLVSLLPFSLVWMIIDEVGREGGSTLKEGLCLGMEEEMVLDEWVLEGEGGNVNFGRKNLSRIKKKTKNKKKLKNLNKK